MRGRGRRRVEIPRALRELLETACQDKVPPLCRQFPPSGVDGGVFDYPPCQRDRFPFVKHVIREAWRRKMLEQHSSSSRRDAVFIDYDERCMKRVRTYAAESRHSLAILSGAYVSHARFAQMTGSEMPLCPYCNERSSVPSRDHVWWHCQGISRPQGLRPLTEAQRLLGWPAGGRHVDHDRRVLAFLEKVRESDLKLRYER